MKKIESKVSLLSGLALCLSWGFIASDHLCSQQMVEQDLADSIDPDQIEPDQVRFFESKIRPVLVKECYSCHSNEVGQVRGGLWLDTREAVLAGGDSGAAVVPFDVEASLLWNAINHIDYAMPPRKKLSDQVIEDFRTWIEMGAPDPRTNPQPSIKTTISAAEIEAGRQFWSFQAPLSVNVPTLDSTWPQTPIDQFVMEKWLVNGIETVGEATAETVLRRLCFDLIGLPPTDLQQRRFMRDWKRDPQSAIERQVDELLALPEFGERWGRHWLDAVRYAESSGREVNVTFPHAWRYRDYVIDSFRNDKPYDRFLLEQLAGDLLPVDSDQQWQQNLVATGFMALGPKVLNERNARQFQLDQIDEQIDVTTRVMLGVSVACARCHDHKTDPIPQSDYYALAGIFSGMTTHYGTSVNQQNRRTSKLIAIPGVDEAKLGQPISRTEMKELQSELAKMRDDVRDLTRQRNRDRNRSDTQALQRQIILLTNQIGSLQSMLDGYNRRGEPVAFCMGVQDASPTNQRILERGELNQPGEFVSRGFPQVLCSEPTKISRQSTGRLEFAQWVASPQNPLTARVMANRIWQHLMGHGLVRTADDFGATGDAPTHPELLDYLALKFVEQGWSTKQLIRSIVLSKTYRISSQHHEANFQIDPDNQLIWRREIKRLEAEAIRDAMLAISGNLDRQRPTGSLIAEAGDGRVRGNQIVGAQLKPTTVSTASTSATGRERVAQAVLGRISEGVIQPKVTSLDQVGNYRSIYLPVVRDNLHRILEVFDFADPSIVIPQRDTSNTPDQGLFFLNSEFAIAQADALANRLLDAEETLDRQVELAFQLTLGRSPTQPEREVIRQFVEQFEVHVADRGPRRGAEQRRRNVRNDGSNYFRRQSEPVDPAVTVARQREIQHKKLSAFCQAIMASAEFRYLK